MYRSNTSSNELETLHPTPLSLSPTEVANPPPLSQSISPPPPIFLTQSISSQHNGNTDNDSVLPPKSKTNEDELITKTKVELVRSIVSRDGKSTTIMCLLSKIKRIETLEKQWNKINAPLMSNKSHYLKQLQYQLHNHKITLFYNLDSSLKESDSKSIQDAVFDQQVDNVSQIIAKMEKCNNDEELAKLEAELLILYNEGMLVMCFCVFVFPWLYKD